MFAQFRYLDGQGAGAVHVASRDFATIGRHPESDFPLLDASEQLVSVRHAAVFRQGGDFLVRDLGSGNGTYLNDTRVRGDRALKPGDVLRLGATGPRLEFGTTMALPQTAPPKTAAAESPAPSTDIFRPRRRSTSQATPKTAEPARRNRWPVTIGVVAIGLSAGLWVWRVRETRAMIEQHRARIVLQVDEQQSRLGQATSSLPGLAALLDSAKRVLTGLRSTILTAPPKPQRLDSLAQQLAATVLAQEPLLHTSRFDPGPVVAARQLAVAVLIAEFSGGAVQSGSAVVVKSLGDTLWLAAPRHIVVDSVGARASRIATILAGARQAYLSTTVRDSGTVALLQVVVRRNSVVAPPLGTADSASGPVVAVGFPFGGDSLGDWRRAGAMPKSFVGMVVTSTGPAIEVAGLGVDAPLGSVVLRPDSSVLGVVERSRGGRWMLARLPLTPD